jgi:3-methyladenine DNA glycosylase AlkD
MNLAPLIREIEKELVAAADPKTKDWWDRYLRHTIEFRGTKMADTRRSVGTVLRTNGLDGASPATKELAFAMIHQPMAEDKLAGILLLAEWVLPAQALDCSRDLSRLGVLFDDGHIDDWNTCDWLCVKVLGPMAEAHGFRCARAIAQWAPAPGLWRSRAGVVAFVNLVQHPHEPIPGLRRLVLEACSANVLRPERFAQTSVGWTIREMSRSAPDLAQEFVEANLSSMSREAARSATARLDADVRNRLLAEHAKRTKGT